MARYDWGWNREQGMGGGGYGSDYGGWAAGWDRFGSGARRGYGSDRGWASRAGGYGGASGYDREYGPRGGYGGGSTGGGYGGSYGGTTGGGYGGSYSGGSYGGSTGGGYTRGAGAGGGYGAGGAGGYGGYTGGYDRGFQGGSYPTYGGVPGGQERGMYYGGRGGAPGYGADYGTRMGGPGQTGRYGGGYDSGYAREPFLPEEVYRRHPEFNRPQRHVSGRWPDTHGDMAGEMDDDEVRQAVRESLYGDGWIDAEAIDVEVTDGVVTMTGEVNDYMEARYAWDDAWETMGVRGVVNQLTVRTDQPSSDHGDKLPQSGGGKRKSSGGGAASGS